MVARGDLGVEVPLEQVPLIQKRIVNKCLVAAKPVIIATQMMESMITSMTPTRAEVNDVANAVLDGADAVMLSAETSVGAYPIETVSTMASIIRQVESEGLVAHTLEDHPPRRENDRYITNSICYNAAKIADQVAATAILTMTHSGYTAFQISSHRPASNIYVFTANRSILNMVSLVWGAKGFYYDRLTTTDETFEDIKKIIQKAHLVEPGDLIIKIASMPIRELGMTNMLKISQV
jgi:pyruvate kinase